MIGLIAARSLNNIIGKNGRIPWQIPGEQQQFKELTSGNLVIMGRKTYEEIGHPLPDRITIVVSKSKKFEDENLRSADSVKNALALALQTPEYAGKDIYFAGGYSIYKEALAYVDVMYITQVQLQIQDGDVTFPEFDATKFKLTVGQTLGDKIKYTRTIYKRIIC